MPEFEGGLMAEEASLDPTISLERVYEEEIASPISLGLVAISLGVTVIVIWLTRKKLAESGRR